MNVFILIMTIQFNAPNIKPKDSVIDVYYGAFKTKETCWVEANRLETVFRPSRPSTDVLFMCVGKGDVL